ncbi:MAG: 16S rRNA (uracil(1498)-N(3))-methyltransferase [Peptococcaceae bacterium]
MRRFFVSPEEIKDNKIYLQGTDARHLSQVLRIKAGEKIIAIDGTGSEYQVQLTMISDSLAEGIITGVTSSARDAGIDVTLVQGIPKGDKMELIIQKCTELGVKRIVPVVTERTIVKLDEGKKEKRRDRWQKIAREASKQCKRGTVPEITAICTWEEYLGFLDRSEEVLVLWEDEAAIGLKGYLTEKLKPDAITLIIGPEGGLSLDEVNKLAGRGAQTVSLGPRILRTETAGFAALIMVLYEFGDLG